MEPAAESQTLLLHAGMDVVGGGEQRTLQARYSRGSRSNCTRIGSVALIQAQKLGEPHIPTLKHQLASWVDGSLLSANDIEYFLFRFLTGNLSLQFPAA